MDSNLLVSILMPIFKVEQYLGRTLDSIFTQSYPNLEYVFVNDCSPDNSLQVLEKSIEQHQIPIGRYTIINHLQNEGIAVSRADCISRAKGDYFFFVDSDDWIEADTNSCRDNMLRCLNYDIATVLWKLLIRSNLFENFKITPHVDIVEDYIMSVKLYYYANSFVSIPQAFYHYVQYNQARVSLQTLWSVNMHIKGVEEVEAFCREKGLYDETVAHKLLLRKFNIKSNFLTKELLDYNSYKHTFPEADRMWRELGYSKKEKFKFWLAEHNLFSVLKLLQR